MTTGDDLIFPSDDSNPYAPPTTSAKPDPVAAMALPVPCTIDGILVRTWEVYRDRMGLSIGVVVVYMILLGGAMLAYGLSVSLPDNSKPAMVIVPLVVVPASMLFSLWISIGLVVVMLDIAHGRPARIALFGGGRYLFRFILAYILMVLMAGGVVLGALLIGAFGMAAAAAAGPDRQWLGMLIFIPALLAGYFAAFLVSLRFSQFIYLIVDRDLGAIESLRESFRITRGHVLMLFVISLLGGVINAAGMMACFVGMLFTTPYIILMMVVAYLAVSGQATNDAYSKGAPAADLEMY
jgi:hypothetical protein